MDPSIPFLARQIAPLPTRRLAKRKAFLLSGSLSTGHLATASSSFSLPASVSTPVNRRASLMKIRSESSSGASSVVREEQQGSQEQAREDPCLQDSTSLNIIVLGYSTIDDGEQQEEQTKNALDGDGTRFLTHNATSESLPILRPLQFSSIRPSAHPSPRKLGTPLSLRVRPKPQGGSRVASKFVEDGAGRARRQRKGSPLRNEVDGYPPPSTTSTTKGKERDLTSSNPPSCADLPPTPTTQSSTCTLFLRASKPLAFGGQVLLKRVLDASFRASLAASGLPLASILFSSWDPSLSIPVFKTKPPPLAPSFAVLVSEPNPDGLAADLDHRCAPPPSPRSLGKALGDDFGEEEGW